MRGRKKGEGDAWAAAFCYVLAPLVFLYVLWVLTDAMQSGKRRLYFLSGNGYMMYLVAEYVCERWQLPLECKYLYLSVEDFLLKGKGPAGWEEMCSDRLGYLWQEGMLDNVRYAIVGSGWSGRVQRSLKDLLQSAGYSRKVEGYYFGLYEYAEGVEPELCHTWYFAPEGGNWKKTFFSRWLFDSVLGASAESVKGYCRRGDRYEPVFAEKEKSDRRRMEAGVSILLQYAKYYTDGCGYGSGKGKDRMGRNPRLEMCVITGLLSSFMGSPSKREAQAFRKYLFGKDAAYPVWQEAWPEADMALSGVAGGIDSYKVTWDKFLLYFRESLGQKRRNRRNRS